jgi:hypothetical protein
VCTLRHSAVLANGAIWWRVRLYFTLLIRSRLIHGMPHVTSLSSRMVYGSKRCAVRVRARRGRCAVSLSGE